MLNPIHTARYRGLLRRLLDSVVKLEERKRFKSSNVELTDYYCYSSTTDSSHPSFSSITPLYNILPSHTYAVNPAVRFAALGLHTVPIVCVAVTHTTDLVVAVGVSTILPVGRTPTVISALPFPCCPSTTKNILPTVPAGSPAAFQAA
jgi:hypothetical protein